MNKQVYDKDYIDSLNLTYNYAILNVYGLSDNNKINAKFIELFNCLKNLLDEYLLNCLPKKFRNKVEFKYGFKFENLDFDLYYDIINLYINGDSDEIKNKIKKNIQKLVYINDINAIKIKFIDYLASDDDIKSIILPVAFDISNEPAETKIYEDIFKVNNKINKYSRLLPLGSVVKLVGKVNEYMILGYGAVDKKDNIHDYFLCLYPNGISCISDANYADHNDIRDILLIGLDNDETKKYRQAMAYALDNSEILMNGKGDINEDII